MLWLPVSPTTSKSLSRRDVSRYGDTLDSFKLTCQAKSSIDLLQEGNTSAIELTYIKKDGDDSDDDFYDDPEIVKLMVHYSYHFDYPDPTRSSEPTTTAVATQLTAVDQTKKIREGVQALKTGNGKTNGV